MKKKIYLIFSLLIYCSLLLFSIDKNSNNTRQQNIIPIDYRGHIYIKGAVKDVDGNFVFDTGADNLYFDSLFYNTSNLKYDSIAIANLPGVGKEPQKVKVIMNSVKFDFGGLNYQTKVVPVLSLKTILGDFADGIIGLNYFSNKILEINYKQKYLKIHDDIDSLSFCQYTKIQCQNIKNRLYIPISLKINDTISISDKFIIDLGSGSSVSLTSPVASKYKLDKAITNKVKYYTRYGGVGGESGSYSFIAKSIEIGGYKLNNFEAYYSTDKSGALSTTKNAGLLGNEILDRFDVIIDFKTFCIYIKPNRSFTDTFRFSKLGFSFVDRSKTLDALIVTGFFENSQAEKSGLRIDDKIIDIDNIRVKEMDYHKLKDYINKTNKLILRVNRGTESLNIEIIQSQILRKE